MTKAQRILALYETGKYTTRQIADVVDCGTSYVRVVARQRHGTGYSPSDLRYLLRKFGGESKTTKDVWRNRARHYRAKPRTEARAS